MGRGAPSGRWRGGSRLRWVRRIVLVVLAFIALGGLLLLVSLTHEPMRAAIWQRLGQQCGTVAAEMGTGRPLTDPAAVLRAEACFMDGYAHCRAVSLADVRGGLDSWWTHTFVVEPALGPLAGCGVADEYRADVDAGLISSTRTERCAAMVQEPNGLHALACGSLGDITVGGP